VELLVRQPSSRRQRLFYRDNATNSQVLRATRWQMFPIGKLLAFAGLSVADLVLTWTLLQLNGGNIYEGNPIANAWLAQYGWRGLILFKLMAVLLFSSASLVVFYYRPGGKATRVIDLGCCLLGVVVLYSLFLLRSCT
jgi:hypothetical protein